MAGLSEQELAEIDRHMRARDHLNDGTPWDEQWCEVYSELADDVPGLVAEVRRLRAFIQTIVTHDHQSCPDGGCDQVFTQAHVMLDPASGPTPSSRRG